MQTVKQIYNKMMEKGDHRCLEYLKKVMKNLENGQLGVLH